MRATKETMTERAMHRYVMVGALVLALGLGACQSGPQAKGEEAAEKAARGVSSDTDARKQFTKAVDLYEKTDGDDLGGVEKHLRKALNEDDGFGKAWFNLGVILEKQDKTDEARKAYKKAMEMAPELGDPLVNLGVLELDAGNKAKAYDYFDQALEAESFNPKAHSNLSVKFRLKENWKKSVSHARQALAGDAQDLDAYENLARTYYASGAYDPAKLVILNALKKNKKRPDLHNIHGVVELARDKVTSAIKKFETAIKIDPDHVPARMNLGAVMLNVRDYDAALTHFNKVLELQPKNTEARISVAVAHRSKGNLEKARKIYDEILEKHPEHPTVHYNLAVMEHEHLAAKASEGIGRGNAPEDPVEQMDWTIGNLKASVKHYKKAIEYYRNYLAFDESGDKKARKEANERIEQVDELISSTEEQIPKLRKQKKTLKKQMAKQKKRQKKQKKKQKEKKESKKEGSTSAEGDGSQSPGKTSEGQDSAASGESDDNAGGGGGE